MLRLSALPLVALSLLAVSPALAGAQEAAGAKPSAIPLKVTGPNTLKTTPGSFASGEYKVNTSHLGPVSWHLEGAPNGATLDPKTGRLVWRAPRFAWSEGEAELVATQGERVASLRVKLEVRVDEESGFRPGVGYTFWQPSALAEQHGTRVQVNFVDWSHQNDRHGPSHGQVYFLADIFGESGGGLTVLTGLGFNLSFERNPRREFLIPFFGLDGSFLVRGDAEGEFTLAPYGGLYLWANRNAWVNLHGGYLIPLGASLDTHNGLRAGLTAAVILW